MKFYTDPTYFFELWCHEMQKDTEMQKKELKKRKKGVILLLRVIKLLTHFDKLKTSKNSFNFAVRICWKYGMMYVILGKRLSGQHINIIRFSRKKLIIFVQFGTVVDCGWDIFKLEDPGDNNRTELKRHIWRINDLS